MCGLMAPRDAQVHRTSNEDGGYKHPSSLYLLYHELQATKTDYGYALPTDSFREHLELFATLQDGTGESLNPVITFDDGHRSNFEQALPLLISHKVSAHFFITAGWTSTRPDYMSWDQLRTLQREGQQIGAHGWSHKLLTHCSDAELGTELVTSRQVLEDKLGTAITAISLPGGRFNRRVLAACKRAGYRQVFTSVPEVRQVASSELVGRLNLRAGVTLPWLKAVLTPSSGVLRRMHFNYKVKAAAQRALGDPLYMKLWAALNRAESGVHPA